MERTTVCERIEREYSIQARISVIGITADIEAIIKQAMLSFVATVNEDGTPNLSPKASLTVMNDVLYFADIASPRTIRNLRRNPAVEINVVDIFQRRGYRFQGNASILRPSDDAYLMIADWVRTTNGPEYPVDPWSESKLLRSTPCCRRHIYTLNLHAARTNSGTPTIKSTVSNQSRDRHRRCQALAWVSNGAA